MPRDSALAKGVNTLEGRVTHQAVEEALGLDQVPVGEALAAAQRRQSTSRRKAL